MRLRKGLYLGLALAGSLLIVQQTQAVTFTEVRALVISDASEAAYREGRTDDALWQLVGAAELAHEAGNVALCETILAAALDIVTRPTRMGLPGPNATRTSALRARFKSDAASEGAAQALEDALRALVLECGG